MKYRLLLVILLFFQFSCIQVEDFPIFKSSEVFKSDIIQNDCSEREINYFDYLLTSIKNEYDNSLFKRIYFISFSIEGEVINYGTLILTHDSNDEIRVSSIISNEEKIEKSIEEFDIGKFKDDLIFQNFYDYSSEMEILEIKAEGSECYKLRGISSDVFYALKDLSFFDKEAYNELVKRELKEIEYYKEQIRKYESN